MVDLDELENSKSGSSSSDENKQSGPTKSESTSNSSSGASVDADTFNIGEENLSEPGDEVPGLSKEWADEHGELDYDKGADKDLKTYMKLQKQEVQELHESIEEILPEHLENIDEFTLFFHSLFINFGVNRAGIMDILQNRYGKSEREAVKLTNKICKSAGEDELINHLLNELAKAGVE